MKTSGAIFDDLSMFSKWNYWGILSLKIDKIVNFSGSESGAWILWRFSLSYELVLGTLAVRHESGDWSLCSYQAKSSLCTGVRRTKHVDGILGSSKSKQIIFFFFLSFALKSQECFQLLCYVGYNQLKEFLSEWSPFKSLSSSPKTSNSAVAEVSNGPLKQG